MAKKCYLCNKGTMSGVNRRHKHSKGWRYKAPRNKVKYHVNGRKDWIVVLEDGKEVRKKVFICMKCYKRMKKQKKYKGAVLSRYKVAEAN